MYFHRKQKIDKVYKKADEIQNIFQICPLNEFFNR